MFNTLKHLASGLVVAVVFFLIGLGIAHANVPTGSLQQLARQGMEPISVLTRTMYNICYVLGGTMLLGSVIQYKNYRDNPSQVRLSRPIFLLVIGLVLLAIPFIGNYSEGATIALRGS